MSQHDLAMSEMSQVDRAALERATMVQRQLRERGIRDRAVLEAMARVPRERFLPAELAELAYHDRALGIDCGQTISQPYIVALMSEALAVRPTDTVLEIGTGSGYQTAILAELAARVISIERHPELAARAAALLAELGYSNVHFLVGDGCLGCPEFAPFPRILVAAAAAQVPPALCDQLAERGILVLPVGGREGQVLEAIHRAGGKLHSEHLSACRFVPLIGSAASDPDSL